ncbi:hypothetical protein ACPPVV_03395 [Rhodanobacter sp. Col0626]|uniref:hypothetical protein n=1 Tax=Rhodanobacter sp. Col0626 TaxID=3415679 RepID=UPI003CE82FB5
MTALLATGLMGSALAHNATADRQPTFVTSPTTSVSGNKTAMTQSLGDVMPFHFACGGDSWRGRCYYYRWRQ